MFLNMFRIVWNLLLTEILPKVEKKSITVGGILQQNLRETTGFSAK